MVSLGVSEKLRSRGLARGEVMQMLHADPARKPSADLPSRSPKSFFSSNFFLQEVVKMLKYFIKNIKVTHQSSQVQSLKSSRRCAAAFPCLTGAKKGKRVQRKCPWFDVFNDPSHTCSMSWWGEVSHFSFAKKVQISQTCASRE